MVSQFNHVIQIQNVTDNLDCHKVSDCISRPCMHHAFQKIGEDIISYDFAAIERKISHYEWRTLFNDVRWLLVNTSHEQNTSPEYLSKISVILKHVSRLINTQNKMYGIFPHSKEFYMVLAQYVALECSVLFSSPTERLIKVHIQKRLVSSFTSLLYDTGRRLTRNIRYFRQASLLTALYIFTLILKNHEKFNEYFESMSVIIVKDLDMMTDFIKLRGERQCFSVQKVLMSPQCRVIYRYFQKCKKYMQLTDYSTTNHNSAKDESEVEDDDADSDFEDDSPIFNLPLKIKRIMLKPSRDIFLIHLLDAFATSDLEKVDVYLLPYRKFLVSSSVSINDIKMTQTPMQFDTSSNNGIRNSLLDAPRCDSSKSVFGNAQKVIIPTEQLLGDICFEEVVPMPQFEATNCVVSEIIHQPELFQPALVNVVDQQGESCICKVPGASKVQLPLLETSVLQHVSPLAILPSENAADSVFKIPPDSLSQDFGVIKSAERLKSPQPPLETSSAESTYPCVSSENAIDSLAKTFVSEIPSQAPVLDIAVDELSSHSSETSIAHIKATDESEEMHELPQSPVEMNVASNSSESSVLETLSKNDTEVPNLQATSPLRVEIDPTFVETATADSILPAQSVLRTSSENIINSGKIQELHVDTSSISQAKQYLPSERVQQLSETSISLLKADSALHVSSETVLDTLKPLESSILQPVSLESSVLHTPLESTEELPILPIYQDVTSTTLENALVNSEATSELLTPLVSETSNSQTEQMSVDTSNQVPLESNESCISQGKYVDETALDTSQNSVTESDFEFLLESTTTKMSKLQTLESMPSTAVSHADPSHQCTSVTAETSVLQVPSSISQMECPDIAKSPELSCSTTSQFSYILPCESPENVTPDLSITPESTPLQAVPLEDNKLQVPTDISVSQAHLTPCQSSASVTVSPEMPILQSKFEKISLSQDKSTSNTSKSPSISSDLQDDSIPLHTSSQNTTVNSAETPKLVPQIDIDQSSVSHLESLKDTVPSYCSVPPIDLTLNCGASESATVPLVPAPSQFDIASVSHPENTSNSSPSLGSVTQRDFILPNAFPEKATVNSIEKLEVQTLQFDPKSVSQSEVDLTSQCPLSESDIMNKETLKLQVLSELDTTISQLKNTLGLHQVSSLLQVVPHMSPESATVNSSITPESLELSLDPSSAALELQASLNMSPKTDGVNSSLMLELPSPSNTDTLCTNSRESSNDALLLMDEPEPFINEIEPFSISLEDEIALLASPCEEDTVEDVSSDSIIDTEESLESDEETNSCVTEVIHENELDCIQGLYGFMEHSSNDLPETFRNSVNPEQQFQVENEQSQLSDISNENLVTQGESDENLKLLAHVADEHSKRCPDGSIVAFQTEIASEILTVVAPVIDTVNSESNSDTSVKKSKIIKNVFAKKRRGKLKRRKKTRKIPKSPSDTSSLSMSLSEEVKPIKKRKNCHQTSSEFSPTKATPQQTEKPKKQCKKSSESSSSDEVCRRVTRSHSKSEGSISPRFSGAVCHLDDADADEVVFSMTKEYEDLKNQSLQKAASTRKLRSTKPIDKISKKGKSKSVKTVTQSSVTTRAKRMSTVDNYHNGNTTYPENSDEESLLYEPLPTLNNEDVEQILNTDNCTNISESSNLSEPTNVERPVCFKINKLKYYSGDSDVQDEATFKLENVETSAETVDETTTHPSIKVKEGTCPFQEGGAEENLLQQIKTTTLSCNDSLLPRIESETTNICYETTDIHSKNVGVSLEDTDTHLKITDTCIPFDYTAIGQGTASIDIGGTSEYEHKAPNTVSNESETTTSISQIIPLLQTRTNSPGDATIPELNIDFKDLMLAICGNSDIKLNIMLPLASLEIERSSNVHIVSFGNEQVLSEHAKTTSSEQPQEYVAPALLHEALSIRTATNINIDQSSRLTSRTRGQIEMDDESLPYGCIEEIDIPTVETAQLTSLYTKNIMTLMLDGKADDRKVIVEVLPCIENGGQFVPLKTLETSSNIVESEESSLQSTSGVSELSPDSEQALFQNCALSSEKGVLPSEVLAHTKLSSAEGGELSPTCLEKLIYRYDCNITDIINVLKGVAKKDSCQLDSPELVPISNVHENSTTLTSINYAEAVMSVDVASPETQKIVPLPAKIKERTNSFNKIVESLQSVSTSSTTLPEITVGESCTASTSSIGDPCLNSICKDDILQPFIPNNCKLSPVVYREYSGEVETELLTCFSDFNSSNRPTVSPDIVIPTESNLNSPTNTLSSPVYNSDESTRSSEHTYASREPERGEMSNALQEITIFKSDMPGENASSVPTEIVPNINPIKLNAILSSENAQNIDVASFEDTLSKTSIIKDFDAAVKTKKNNPTRRVTGRNLPDLSIATRAILDRIPKGTSVTILNPRKRNCSDTQMQPNSKNPRVPIQKATQIAATKIVSQNGAAPCKPTVKRKYTRRKPKMQAMNDIWPGNYLQVLINDRDKAVAIAQPEIHNNQSVCQEIGTKSEYNHQIDSNNRKVLTDQTLYYVAPQIDNLMGTNYSHKTNAATVVAPASQYQSVRKSPQTSAITNSFSIANLLSNNSTKNKIVTTSNFVPKQKSRTDWDFSTGFPTTEGPPSFNSTITNPTIGVVADKIFDNFNIISNKDSQTRFNYYTPKETMKNTSRSIMHNDYIIPKTLTHWQAVPQQINFNSNGIEVQSHGRKSNKRASARKRKHSEAIAKLPKMSYYERRMNFDTFSQAQRMSIERDKSIIQYANRMNVLDPTTYGRQVVPIYAGNTDRVAENNIANATLLLWEQYKWYLRSVLSWSNPLNGMLSVPQILGNDCNYEGFPYGGSCIGNFGLQGRICNETQCVSVNVEPPTPILVPSEPTSICLSNVKVCRNSINRESVYNSTNNELTTTREHEQSTTAVENAIVRQKKPSGEESHINETSRSIDSAKTSLDPTNGETTNRNNGLFVTHPSTATCHTQTYSQNDTEISNYIRRTTLCTKTKPETQVCDSTSRDDASEEADINDDLRNRMWTSDYVENEWDDQGIVSSSSKIEIDVSTDKDIPEEVKLGEPSTMHGIPTSSRRRNSDESILNEDIRSHRCTSNNNFERSSDDDQEVVSSSCKLELDINSEDNSQEILVSEDLKMQEHSLSFNKKATFCRVKLETDDNHPDREHVPNKENPLPNGNNVANYNKKVVSSGSRIMQHTNIDDSPTNQHSFSTKAIIRELILEKRKALARESFKKNKKKVYTGGKMKEYTKWDNNQTHANSTPKEVTIFKEIAEVKPGSSKVSQDYANSIDNSTIVQNIPKKLVLNNIIPEKYKRSCNKLDHINKGLESYNSLIQQQSKNNNPIKSKTSPLEASISDNLTWKKCMLSDSSTDLKNKKTKSPNNPLWRQSNNDNYTNSADVPLETNDNSTGEEGNTDQNNKEAESSNETPQQESENNDNSTNSAGVACETSTNVRSTWNRCTGDTGNIDQSNKETELSNNPNNDNCTNNTDVLRETNDNSTLKKYIPDQNNKLTGLTNNLPGQLSNNDDNATKSTCISRDTNPTWEMQTFNIGNIAQSSKEAELSDNSVDLSREMPANVDQNNEQVELSNKPTQQQSEKDHNLTNNANVPKEKNDNSTSEECTHDADNIDQNNELTESHNKSFTNKMNHHTKINEDPNHRDGVPDKVIGSKLIVHKRKASKAEIFCYSRRDISSRSEMESDTPDGESPKDSTHQQTIVDLKQNESEFTQTAVSVKTTVPEQVKEPVNPTIKCKHGTEQELICTIQPETSLIQTNQHSIPEVSSIRKRKYHETVINEADDSEEKWKGIIDELLIKQCACRRTVSETKRSSIESIIRDLSRSRKHTYCKTFPSSRSEVTQSSVDRIQFKTYTNSSDINHATLKNTSKRDLAEKEINSNLVSDITKYLSLRNGHYDSIKNQIKQYNFLPKTVIKAKKGLAKIPLKYNVYSSIMYDLTNKDLIQNWNVIAHSMQTTRIQKNSSKTNRKKTNDASPQSTVELPTSMEHHKAQAHDATKSLQKQMAKVISIQNLDRFDFVVECRHISKTRDRLKKNIQNICHIINNTVLLTHEEFRQNCENKVIPKSLYNICKTFLEKLNSFVAATSHINACTDSITNMPPDLLVGVVSRCSQASLLTIIPVVGQILSCSTSIYKSLHKLPLVIDTTTLVDLFNTLTAPDMFETLQTICACVSSIALKSNPKLSHYATMLSFPDINAPRAIFVDVSVPGPSQVNMTIHSDTLVPEESLPDSTTSALSTISFKTINTHRPAKEFYKRQQFKCKLVRNPRWHKLTHNKQPPEPTLKNNQFSKYSGSKDRLNNHKQLTECSLALANNQKSKHVEHARSMKQADMTDTPTQNRHSNKWSHKHKKVHKTQKTQAKPKHGVLPPSKCHITEHVINNIQESRHSGRRIQPVIEFPTYNNCQFRPTKQKKIKQTSEHCQSAEQLSDDLIRNNCEPNPDAKAGNEKQLKRSGFAEDAVEQYNYKRQRTTDNIEEFQHDSLSEQLTNSTIGKEHSMNSQDSCENDKLQQNAKKPNVCIVKPIVRNDNKQTRSRNVWQPRRYYDIIRPRNEATGLAQCSNVTNSNRYANPRRKISDVRFPHVRIPYQDNSELLHINYFEDEDQQNQTAGTFTHQCGSDCITLHSSQHSKSVDPRRMFGINMSPANTSSSAKSLRGPFTTYQPLHIFNTAINRDFQEYGDEWREFVERQVPNALDNRNVFDLPSE